VTCQASRRLIAISTSSQVHAKHFSRYFQPHTREQSLSEFNFQLLLEVHFNLSLKLFFLSSFARIRENFSPTATTHNGTIKTEPNIFFVG